MQAGTLVKITKIKSAPNALFPPGKWGEFMPGNSAASPRHSLPVAHAMEGVLLADVEVGKPVYLARMARNGEFATASRLPRRADRRGAGRVRATRDNPHAGASALRDQGSVILFHAGSPFGIHESFGPFPWVQCGGTPPYTFSSMPTPPTWFISQAICESEMPFERRTKT